MSNVDRSETRIAEAVERAWLVLKTARHYDGPLVGQTRDAVAKAVREAVAHCGAHDIDTLAQEALVRVVADGAGAAHTHDAPQRAHMQAHRRSPLPTRKRRPRRS